MTRRFMLALKNAKIKNYGALVSQLVSRKEEEFQVQYPIGRYHAEEVEEEQSGDRRTPIKSSMEIGRLALT